MTSTTANNGRLGNQIIRNLAVSLVAEKHNLFVNYSSKNIITQLGINLFCGCNSYNNIISLNDDNFFNILEINDLKSNLNANDSYFQTKELTNFLYKHLHSVVIKDKIIESNPFKDRYNCNNDTYIHVRLADASIWNPGLNYYLKTLSTVDSDKIYLSTDDIHHSFIKEIMRKYPNIVILEYDEIKTIQFASTCRNIILSHGSFSAVIGYLSFYSNINYPEYESGKIWYGDMFSIDGWIKHSLV